MQQYQSVAALLDAALEHGFDEADLHDAAALKTSLSQVEASIAHTEASIVAVVQNEHTHVDAVLSSAGAIKSQLMALEDTVTSVPCEELRNKLENTVLQVPGLRQKLEAARASHSLLCCLAEIQRWLGLVDAEASSSRTTAAHGVSSDCGNISRAQVRLHCTTL